jgi:diguanylate cyclase (GGDEF)-like protein/PAS domain S-box-containing protein
MSANQAKTNMGKLAVIKADMRVQPTDKTKQNETTSTGQSVIIDAARYREKTRAEIALNSISEAVFCTDIYGNIDYLNVAAEKITGWSREEANGKPSNQIFKIIDGLTRKASCDPVRMVLQTNKPSAIAPDTVLVKRDGSEVAIEDSASPIYSNSGQLTGVVVIIHDISGAKAMSSKMAYLAQHDFLTKLPNRVLLNDRISQAVAFAKRHHTQLSVLFLDLDNFKHINDSLGHAVGDKLLQSISQRLLNCVRSSDTVSRQGGDEFIVLLADNKNGQDAALTAEKILEEFKPAHKLGVAPLHISTSIGISVFPNDGLDAETLIKNADIAMYFAKQKGRDNYQFFKSTMSRQSTQRMNIEAGLRSALEQQQFTLRYQPKVNLVTNQITDVEVFLRWQHVEWGEVLPLDFLTIAADCGLIIPIGRWVLREACYQAKQWLNSGISPITIAVNISQKEFMHKDFVESVRAILVETQLPANCLELEITESALMRDANHSMSILHDLKKMGLKLSVDDFGTGYSSLSYLQLFPIDALKIDQSFVHQIVSVMDDDIILSAIISIGHKLKLKVIAKGVENKMQLDFLKSQQCHGGQGNFFSPALTGEQCASLLAETELFLEVAD